MSSDAPSQSPPQGGPPPIPGAPLPRAGSTGPGGPAALGARLRGVQSPLYGRDRELELLNGALQRAIDYQAPQIVTVVGNQGTGKSRLVREFAKTIRPPVRVVEARATSPEIRHEAIARLLRTRFGLGDAEELEAARGRFRDAVQAVFGDRRVAEVVHFLGGFLDFRFADSPFARAFEDDPRQHEEIQRTVLRRFLEADALASPLVVVLDGLENADDATLELLEELASSLAGAPLVVIACARPDLLVRRPAWGQAGDQAKVELKNLPPEEAANLFRALLARCEKIPEDLVEDAVEMTGGNPYFLEELVRVMLGDGTIKEAGDRWILDEDAAASVELPISVAAAIEARIAALDDDERDLLEKGAVFGNVFWLSAVIAMSRADAGAAPSSSSWDADGLAERGRRLITQLVERDYLLELGPEDSSIAGEREVVFKHNLERELVHKLTLRERQQRHYEVGAQWLESRLWERSEERYEFMAQMHEHAGEPRRAAECFLAGGEKARARFANDTALAMMGRALGLLDPGDALLRLDILHDLGDVLARTGKPDEARAKFEEMLAIAYRYDHPAKGGAAHGRLGRLERERGEFDRALAHYALATELYERAGDKRGQAATLDDVGKIHWMRGGYPTALEHHRQALVLRRALGDKRSIALSLANIGLVHRDSGSFKSAVEMFREAMALRREIGDQPGTVSSLCDLGSVHEADGNLAASHELLTDALKAARAIGDRLLCADVLGRLADVELERGDHATALATLHEAREIAQALGARLLGAECARRTAEVLLSAGSLGRAVEEAQNALALAKALGGTVHVGKAHRVLGAVFAHPGQAPDLQAQAEGHFRTAIEVLAALRNELELARCYRAFAALRQRTGHDADATKLRTRAEEIFGRLRGAAALKPQG